jgi:hypothetical protein
MYGKFEEYTPTPRYYPVNKRGDRSNKIVLLVIWMLDKSDDGRHDLARILAVLVPVADADVDVFWNGRNTTLNLCKPRHFMTLFVSVRIDIHKQKYHSENVLVICNRHQ